MTLDKIYISVQIIMNEMDLHIKVVSFIKKRYPHSIIQRRIGREPG